MTFSNQLQPTMNLKTGKQYNVSELEFVGWTYGDGSGAEGYEVAGFFDAGGVYKGPDVHGIEPYFAPDEHTDPRLHVSMGKFTFDRTEYMRVWQDTPISPPNSSVERGKLVPGTCVKTGNGKVCGKVNANPSTLNGDCVVMGYGWHDDGSDRWVWRGSHYDFALTWNAD